MSYDFSMNADLGGPEPLDLGLYLNYTYNVSGMFREALGGDGVNDLDGKKGGECIEKLRAAVRDMEDRHSHYAAMNPENGWGDYGGALRVLRTLLEWAVHAPNAKFRVS